MHFGAFKSQGSESLIPYYLFMWLNTVANWSIVKQFYCLVLLKVECLNRMSSNYLSPGYIDKKIHLLSHGTTAPVYMCVIFLAVERDLSPPVSVCWCWICHQFWKSFSRHDIQWTSSTLSWVLFSMGNSPSPKSYLQYDITDYQKDQPQRQILIRHSQSFSNPATKLVIATHISRCKSHKKSAKSWTRLAAMCVPMYSQQESAIPTRQLIRTSYLKYLLCKIDMSSSIETSTDVSTGNKCCCWFSPVQFSFVLKWNVCHTANHQL